MTELEWVGPVRNAPPATRDPDRPRGEGFAWFVVAVLAAFYWFSWAVLKSAGWPDAPHRHYYLYAVTLFAVLPLSLITSGVLRVVRDALLQGNQNLLPTLISVQTAFWIWVWARPADGLLAPELLARIRWTLPELVLAAIGLAVASGPRRIEAWSFAESAIFYALPLLGLVLLWHFQGDVPTKRSMIAALSIPAVILAALVIRRRREPSAPLDRWDAVFSVLLVTVLVETVWDINYFHQDFYLGPVNEVLSGRSMLVDVNCQYGVGVIYFLAATFKLLHLKPHYLPFTGLLMALTAVQYVLLYWVVRRIFRSRLLAVVCLVLVVILGRIGFFPMDNIVFPSVGPLRFGLPLLILLAGFLRRTRPWSPWSSGWIEAALLGVASVWSLETCIYSLSAYGFSTLAEAWALRDSLFDFLLRCLRSALRPMAAIAVAMGGLTLVTLLRAGERPHFSIYRSYLNTYSGTLAAWDLAVWTPWILIPGMICLSLLATALRTYARRDLDAGHFFIAGLTGAAAAEYSYFIMRSHPNNLTHIAGPIIVLLFYWLDQSWKPSTEAWQARWAALPVALLILIGISWGGLSNVWACLDRSLLAWTARKAGALIDAEPFPAPDVFAQVWAPKPTTPRAGAHVRLAAKYAPRQREVAAISPDSVEFYSLTGKKDPFRIGCVIQDGLRPGYYDRMVAAPLPLKFGDVIILTDDAKGTLEGPPVVIDAELLPLVVKIKQHFKIEPLERDDPTGIWAARLALPDSPQASDDSRP